MLRTILAVLIAASCAGASAQGMYKCTVKGKVSYSGKPCLEGETKALDVPPAPPPDPALKKEIQRENVALGNLQRERAKREAIEQRGEVQQVDSAREQRCAKLRADKQLADQNAAGAPGFNKANLRAQAERMGEAITAECGS